MKKKSWDEARARSLHAEGLSDLDIADMVGASEGAIKSWRARNRLHSNTPRKPQPKVMPMPAPVPVEESATREAPVAELPPADQPPEAAPAEKTPLTKEEVEEQLFSGPVEVSFSYAGCNVTLTALNHQSALWAAAYLNNIVGSLVPERE